MDYNIFQHFYYSLRFGEWDFGYKSKAMWPEKPLIMIGTTYYDGNHFYFHVWRFYIEASYY